MVELTIDEAMSRLQSHGWSVGDISFASPAGRWWLVFCHKEGDQNRAEAPSQTEAWSRAWQSAASRLN